MIGALVVATASAGPADAADAKAACGEAYVKAQELRDKSSLLAARAQLRICAQPSCKDFIVRSCTEWLEAVEKRIPTVVFVARTRASESLIDVSVSDGKRTLTPTLTGTAIELDPGTYDFTFTSSDGTIVTVKAVVAESQKGQIVRATFPAPTSTADTGDGPSSAGSAAHDPAPSGSGSTYRVVGWSLAGVGVVTTTVGLALMLPGGSTLSDLSASHRCGVDGIENKCVTTADRDQYDAAQSKKTTGLALVLGGGVVALSGILFIALAPDDAGRPATASTMLAPRFTAVRVGPGGISLAGIF